MAELRAACDVEDEIGYTYGRANQKPEGADYVISDLLAEVMDQSDKGESTFDKEGWPLELDPGHSTDTVQSLVAMAAAANKMRGSDNKISVMVLGEHSRPIVSLTSQSDELFAARMH